MAAIAVMVAGSSGRVATAAMAASHCLAVTAATAAIAPAMVATGPDMAATAARLLVMVAMAVDSSVVRSRIIVAMAAATIVVAVGRRLPRRAAWAVRQPWSPRRWELRPPKCRNHPR